MAEELGLDLVAYDAAVADPATLERVVADRAEGVALGVTGTPTFFVDGELVELTSLDSLSTAIEEALARRDG